MEKSNLFYRTWIARDETECLFAYENKPVKSSDEWMGGTGLPNNIFLDVTWEDNEPTEVVMIRKDKLNEFIEDIALSTLRCEYVSLNELTENMTTKYLYDGKNSDRKK